MKVATIIYHKNINAIYNQKWVLKCLTSIKEQTYKDFLVYELCYGAENIQLWKNSVYFNVKFDNHVQAMNFILDKAFKECDIVFNTNLDDFYGNTRFESQIKAVENRGDLISSNFQLVIDKNIPQQSHHVYSSCDLEDNYYQKMIMHDKDTKIELEKGHNVICHPVVCYTKKFWEETKYYDEQYYNTFPRQEDLQLWKKAINIGQKIIILPDILCFYRIHNNQIGGKKAS